MKIRLATATDADAWLAMRAALWPEAGREALKPEVAAFFDGHIEPAMLHRVFVAEAEGGLAGMLELSLRPYVDGCDGSPVPSLRNHVSVHAHAALGFAEVERAIRFRKPLKG